MNLSIASMALLSLVIHTSTTVGRRSSAAARSFAPAFAVNRSAVRFHAAAPGPASSVQQRRISPATFASLADPGLRSTAEDTGTAATEEDIRKSFPLMGKDVMECPPRMRFAPSPTGSLHVGGARTALYNWLAAKKGQLDFSGAKGNNAAFVVRVEDTDLARSTRESEDSVLADLTWLGLNWDEGPDTPTLPYGPYRQSERSTIYTHIASYLLSTSKAYRCFSTAEELEATKAHQEANKLPLRYDGTWRDADPALIAAKLATGTPYTVRFRVPPNSRVVIEDAVRGAVSWDADATVGDFVLLRSSGIPVYNFCVAVDDATMGITTVIRAEEHLTNTLRQGLVLDALGAPRPRYAHCSLILGEDKQKLSKRHGATSCDQFRVDGFLPDAMINYLSLLGWNDGTDNEIFTREELIDAFDVGRVVKSPSIFDMDKLRWVNAQHLKMMSVEELVGLVDEQLRMVGILKDGGGDRCDDVVVACTSLAKQMMETTRDAADNARTVLGYGLPRTFDEMEEGGEAKEMVKLGNFYNIGNVIVEQAEKKALPLPDPADPLAAFMDVGKGGGKKGVIIEADEKLGGGAYSFPEAYKAHMKELAKELGLKGKHLFHPLRLALTGEMSGQDVTKQLALTFAVDSKGDDVVDREKAGIVNFEERIVRLKAFCESIPEEYRAPKSTATTKPTDTNAAQQKSSKTGSATTASGGTADPISTYEGPPITALDIRVGRITKVWEHPEADKLYCEEIDVGEDSPRLIASGLRPFMSGSEMEDRLVLVLCNLKARKMVGIPSHGMVLCASNADHTAVKFVSPPVDAVVGERVTVPGFEFEGEEGAPMKENPMGKKKIFPKLAPFLVTDEYGVPGFLGKPFLTSAGVCTSPIVDGTVS